MAAPLKILHTSDWHLGRSLYGRKRYEEFSAFLDWLADTIERRRIDVLLVAGDVFDTTAPSNRAQALYYRFLERVSRSRCAHVVVIGGNHDSPSFLDAPRALLRALSVHVIGAAAADPAEEVLLLENDAGEPMAIVAAVPYLRDRDIRSAEAGESTEDKARKLVEGIRDHYAAVGAAAQALQERLGQEIPIIGMGHLFAAGGETVEGDGVRELYVGSLAHVSSSVFPDCFDYVALGHLHVPQKVGGAEHIRYAGSPLPMGFGEAGQKKSLCLVAFEERQPTVELLDVPTFQQLQYLSGDWPTLETAIRALVEEQTAAWLEIRYDGDEIIGDLRQRLEELVSESKLEILRIRNNRVVETALGKMREDETLDDLDVHDVFRRCLDSHDIPAEQRDVLIDAYREVVREVEEGDRREE